MVSIALCPSLLVALIASFGMCAAYVGCLYVCASHQTKNGRRGPDRDDPSVIKERFARVGVASLLAHVPLALLAWLTALAFRAWILTVWRLLGVVGGLAEQHVQQGRGGLAGPCPRRVLLQGLGAFWV